MLSIAVCDDEIIECCNMARKIKDILEEMGRPCIVRQFQSGGELLQALESFDIVFLDIIMQDLDGMKTAQIFREKASDKIITQTSHVKNGIRTLKNQYFSPQNTLMRLFLSVPMRPACILGDAQQSWL